MKGETEKKRRDEIEQLAREIPDYETFKQKLEENKDYAQKLFRSLNFYVESGPEGDLRKDDYAWEMLSNGFNDFKEDIKREEEQSEESTD